MSPVSNLNGTYSRKALMTLMRDAQGAGPVAELARTSLERLNEISIVTGLEYAAKIRQGQFAGVAVLEG